MSPKAWVLICTEVEKDAIASVLQEVKKIPGVEMAEMLYGIYDIIAKINPKTEEELKEILLWKLRRIQNVKMTLTMLVPPE